MNRASNLHYKVGNVRKDKKEQWQMVFGGERDLDCIGFKFTMSLYKNDYFSINLRFSITVLIHFLLLRHNIKAVV